MGIYFLFPKQLKYKTIKQSNTKMKTNSKKIMLGVSLALLGSFAAKSQGLQHIVVEKYYKANAADVAAATGQSAVVPLTANSVTYRVYADLAPGYKLLQVFGNGNHTLKVTTTTAFFNDPDNGVASGPQSLTLAKTKTRTTLIDSWLTIGGVMTGKSGVLKSEDTDGTIGNTQGLLANNPGGAFGLPIMGAGAQDGLLPQTITANGLVGISGAQLDAFDQNGSYDPTPGVHAVNQFTANGGSISTLGGVVGATASNMVLIGQFTTDGVLGFELNIQIQPTAGGAAENYVSSNPTGSEFTHPELTLAPNVPPTVSLIGATNAITGSGVLTYTANAADVAPGTVTGVEFFNGATSLGTVASAPYTFTFNPSVAGSYAFTAKATDNSGDATTSSSLILTVAANQAPTAGVTVAATAVVGDVVTATGTGNDVDGSVVSLEFFVDNVSVGTDALAPFTATWTAVVGAHTFKTKATDNFGLVGALSAGAVITVNANNPPTAAIITPVNNAQYLAPVTATITASATDDESVDNVVLLIDGVPTQTITGAGPYVFAYTTSTLSTGNRILTVRSTDNRGASTLSNPVTIIVNDPNALPYEVTPVKLTCLPTTFCLPISAAATYTVNDVIGYDMVLNYDASKVVPTGNITVYNDLIVSSYVQTANSYTNGVMNIIAYFNTSAPANAEFNGTGKLLCVEFAKLPAFGSVDVTTFTVSSLEESRITDVTPQQVSNGTFTTYKDTTFNASLKFWSNLAPIVYDAALPNSHLITNIKGTSASCVLTNTIAVQPNLLGNFTYNLINGQSINIDRDIAGTTPVQAPNGPLSGQDVILGRNLLLPAPTFTPNIYQIIALDVNMDGVVSPGDLSQINQRIILTIPEFKQAWNYNNAGVSNGEKSKDWIFVDSLRIQNNPAYKISTTYPNDNGVGFSKKRVPVTPFCLPVTVLDYANCPLITSETYKGIVVGDVDGDYATMLSNNGTLNKLAKSDDKIILDLTKAIVNGTTVDVPVSIVSSSPVTSLDFYTNINEAKLTANNVVKVSSDKDMEVYSHFNANDKVLRLTSNSLNKFEKNTAIMYVRFDIANGDITSADFNSFEGALNAKRVTVEIKTSESSFTNVVGIHPNPTTGIVNVVASEDGTLQLLDITGKSVLLQTNVIANENQTFDFSEFANGVYILKVSNGKSVTVKKVVLNK